MTPLKEITGITVSLEKAKALYECGWRGQSYWLWAYYCYDYSDEYQKAQKMEHLISRETEDHHHQWKTYLAPTWSDIYFSLPENMRFTNFNGIELTLDAEFIDCWNPAIYSDDRNKGVLFKPTGESMHDNMADMYIYLSQHNLLPSQ